MPAKKNAPHKKFIFGSKKKNLDIFSKSKYLKTIIFEPTLLELGDLLKSSLFNNYFSGASSIFSRKSLIFQ